MKLLNSSQVNFFNVLINITLMLRVFQLIKEVHSFKTSLIASFLFLKKKFIFKSNPNYQFTK